MHLKAVHIRNFRALEEIDIEFDRHVNVVVGPNAIGKTTVLEAIRLAKALLAPRTRNESSQALFSLGFAAPYNPQRLIPEAIARDLTRPVAVRCAYDLEPEEMKIIEEGMAQIATDFVLKGTGQNFENPAMSADFLSSNHGKGLLTRTEAEVRKVLDQIRTNNRACLLDLTIDTTSGRINNGDPVGATFFAFLESRHRPSQTIFTYFPADRAMPAGEQPVQLGGADAAQQIEAHVSQPQLKYTRLKNTIFNAIVTSQSERDELKSEFARIFGGILKGRSLVNVGVNQYGLLSIQVQDSESGRTFDLDGMSSGEKGLILTFLLIGRSVVNGGIVLLDEPELHLNPLVCKDLLSFLVDEYVKRKSLQVIVCSHSPEVLAGVFERKECSLYHLLSEKLVSKIRHKDQDEISEALSRLGTSEGEGLLYKATIFVEGDEDVELLELGFGDLLRRYKLKDLHGRSEVEKQIALLQDAEKRGNKLPSRYFIFDRDDNPTRLASSGSVKILQWGRRSLENYLIDVDVLTDLLKDGDIVKTPVAHSGEVSKLLSTLAISQLNDFVARQVYSKHGYKNPGLRAPEIEGQDLTVVADRLFARLQAIKSQVDPLDHDWKTKFIEACTKERQELQAVWEVKWPEDCDGKRLFVDLHKKVGFKVSVRKFKKRIMAEMRGQRTEKWRSVESLLAGLIAN